MAFSRGFWEKMLALLLLSDVCCKPVEGMVLGQLRAQSGRLSGFDMPPTVLNPRNPLPLRTSQDGLMYLAPCTRVILQ